MVACCRFVKVANRFSPPKIASPLPVLVISTMPSSRIETSNWRMRKNLGLAFHSISGKTLRSKRHLVG